MKTAKLGAIFLVSTMALAGIGAAYAWWVDELYVEVDVTMGTFGWEWTLDWYKDPVTGEIIPYEITHDYKYIIDIPRDATGAPLVDDHVYLEDTQENDPTHPGFEHMDKLHIYAENVYPCTDIEIYCDLHFWGTVPGHLYEYTFDLYLDGVQIFDIPKWMFVLVEVDSESANANLFDQMGITPGTVLPICTFFDLLTDSTQWHESYQLNLLVYIHWIQWDMEFVDPWGNHYDCDKDAGTGDGSAANPYGLGLVAEDVPMDTTISFDISINGCQYNDPTYGIPYPGP